MGGSGREWDGEGGSGRERDGEGGRGREWEGEGGRGGGDIHVGEGERGEADKDRGNTYLENFGSVFFFVIPGTSS